MDIFSKDYGNKYLKYKNKYLNLLEIEKKMIGGKKKGVKEPSHPEIEKTADGFLETKNFLVKKSKRFPDFYDFYFKTDKTDMSKIYGEVLNKAISLMGKSHLDSLYDPVDSRHYCNYMAEKIYGGNNCTNDGGKQICNQWAVLWSQEVYFEPDKKNPNNFIVMLSGVVSGARQRRINFSNYVKELLKSKLENKWIIMPVGVPGHSISILIYKRNENNFEMYFCDPNGPTPLDANSLGFHVNLVRNYCKHICEKELSNIKYMDYMLCDLAPQGGSTLRYIDSQGFCGAFTWMIIFLILINDFVTPEKLYEYINFRTNQWHDGLNTKVDYVDAVKSLSQMSILNKIEIDLRYFNRFSFKIDSKTYTFLKSEGVDGENVLEFIKKPEFNLEKREKFFKSKVPVKEFSKYFFLSNKDPKILENDFGEIVRQISNNLDAAGKAQFRVESLNKLKGAASLNWFENHILMYLMFVKEFFDEQLPIVVTADDKTIIDENYILPINKNNVKFDLGIKNYCKNGYLDQ